MSVRATVSVFLLLSGCPETAETSSGGVGAASTNTGAASSTGSSATGGSSTTGGSGGNGGASPGGAGGSGAAGGSGGNGGAPVGGSGGAGGDPYPDRVRIVAANLTSGNFQAYDPGHGARILAGLNADIVLIQEFNYQSSTTESLDALTEDICEGFDCVWVRGQPQVGIPNGVISRYPILESGSWPDPEVANRDFTYARIDVPGPTDLWAISVHLLTSSAADRAMEASSILGEVMALPAGDFVVLGGDFNTDTRDEPALVTLAASFTVGPLFPMDQAMNGGTNEPRTKPYDWVLADAELESTAVPTFVGGSSFESGAVIDTRVFTPLSALSPALLNDSGAPSMQHMAVVRDFVLPLSEEP